MSLLAQIATLPGGLIGRSLTLIEHFVLTGEGRISPERQMMSEHNPAREIALSVWAGNRGPVTGWSSGPR